ncbi:MAG: prephenate dehydratase [Methylocystaceae bacterium]
MLNQVAYLGPLGSFCGEAAAQLDAARLVPTSSISAVFESVAQGRAEAGVVPAENSWEGAVHQTMDLLAASDTLVIAAELILPVQHQLLARPGRQPGELTRVFSHNQALSQCEAYLSEFCPDAERVEVTSTAQGASMAAAADECWGALASIGAAREYGLEIIAANVCTMPNNETRFLIIKQNDNPVKNNGKTSLVVQAVDRPGALYHLLHEFYTRNISLTRIESRPARTRLGEYRFFIDCIGSRLDEPLVEAIQALEQASVFLRVLGSYPAAQ